MKDSREVWERDGVTIAEVYSNYLRSRHRHLELGTGEHADRCFVRWDPLEIISYQIGPEPNVTHNMYTMRVSIRPFTGIQFPSSHDAGSFGSA
ncbi:hypothetical protein NEUTE2DRAFT_130366 [Neurospora tetrasperma FGSC 2509]|nr:hypothetical protein NEUTE2DRAFT_130366 [Neurospora tetrasperma FGSC 2509]